MNRFIALTSFLILVIALAACARPVVDQDKHITMHYTGTLEDGSTFDSSQGQEPIEFIFGVGMMIPGLETGMKGMGVGEKKTILVKAEDAYGPYLEEMVVSVPRSEFPASIVPEVGMELMAQTMYGPMPVRIKEVTADAVMVDYNAPLAGKDLTFEVEIVAIRDATEEELAPFREAAAP